MNKLTYQENIYTYHIDFVGHVNNINYIQWMENGRVKLLEALGMPVTDMVKSDGIAPILTETFIEYKKALYLNNTVNIDIWISKINNASMIMEFRFYNERGELCATGRQKGSFIDRKTMRPVRMNDEQRTRLGKFYIEE